MSTCRRVIAAVAFVCLGLPATASADLRSGTAAVDSGRRPDVGRASTGLTV